MTNLHFEVLTANLVRTYLKRGIPILTYDGDLLIIQPERRGRPTH